MTRHEIERAVTDAAISNPLTLKAQSRRRDGPATAFCHQVDISLADESRLLIAVFYLEEILNVALGTVKWFNATKGYGFIKPDNGGQDVFVHISAVEKAGYTALADGAKISYELVTGRFGKTSAENLRIG